LAFAAAARDHEVVGDDDELPHVEDDDPLALLVGRGPRRRDRKVAARDALRLRVLTLRHVPPGRSCESAISLLKCRPTPSYRVPAHGPFSTVPATLLDVGLHALGN